MKRYIDLSVTLDTTTMSPPSTNMKLAITPHRRGPGFWQVSSVHQSLHTGAHIDSPLHVFRDGITTAEISLDQVMGEALVVDLSFAGANHAITIDDLKRGGAAAAKKGDIVLLRTDWTDKMYGKWPDYFTQSPYFPPETAEWLVAKDPKNIGFEFFQELCGGGRALLPGAVPAAGGDTRGRRRHHGRVDEPGRSAPSSRRLRGSVLQDRWARRRARSLLR